MSDNVNAKVNDEALDSVAGGITNLDMSGSKTGGDQTVLDQSTTIIEDSKVQYGGESVGGDKIGGDKTDVQTKIDSKVDVNLKTSLF